MSQNSVDRKVIRTAVLVGGASFAIGIGLPIVFGSSNLAPLSAFLISGPIGIVAGVVIGVTLAESRDDRDYRRRIGWLFFAWLFALLYTLGTARLFNRLMLPAVVLQVFITAATPLTLYRHRMGVRSACVR